MASSEKKQVCVVGCGPSGISMLYHLGKLPEREVPDIVCYEKQDSIGGLWNMSWRTGLDKYGEPSHCSMYYDLWINNPHCSNEYPDYTYEEHFGKSLPAYVPREIVRDYLEGRFTRGSKRDLEQFVRLSTMVKRIEYNKETDNFTVIAKNLIADKEEIGMFTHVVVATGMFSTPKLPDIPGIEGFKGRVLHSKDVRHFQEFKGQTVLVVGSFLSAEDIASMLVKFGAAHVFIAYKYRPLGRKWPSKVEERHLVVKFENNTAHFQDQSTAEVDTVIFCTGYSLDFPFLADHLRLKTDQLLYPENLYNGVLWLKGGNNKLMYIGMQYILLTFVTFDCQAIWATLNIMGKLELPTKDEMVADSREWFEMAKYARRNHCIKEKFEFIKKYFRHMVDIVGYPKEVLQLEDQFCQKLEHQRNNICTWRDMPFKCMYTGNECPALKTTWMENFGDSLKAIIDNN